jgi:hypothetical protein
MVRLRWSLSITVVVVAALSGTRAAQTPSPSIFLADIAWPEAEKALTEDAVVILAIGNGSEAHGPHLPLSTDFRQAEYVKEQVARRTNVVVAPSVQYGY